MTARRWVLQVRVSEEEKARIEALASAGGVSVSEWMRSRALEQALGGDHDAPSGATSAVQGNQPARAVPSSPTPARASEVETPPPAPRAPARTPARRGLDAATLARQAALNKPKGL